MKCEHCAARVPSEPAPCRQHNTAPCGADIQGSCMSLSAGYNRHLEAHLHQHHTRQGVLLSLAGREDEV